MAPLAPVLPFISLAASIGGTIYSAISQKKAGKEEKQATEVQAGRIETQIGRVETQVARTGEEEKVRVEQEQEKHRRLLSSARARIGASGVEMEGSPLLAMMESQAQGEKDIANIRKGYQWEVEDLRLSQEDLRLSQEDILYSGTQREKAANVGVGTSLLTGLSSAAERAYKYWGE